MLGKKPVQLVAICIIIFVHVQTSEEQSCVDAVNVQQRGNAAALTGNQVLVPRKSFSCNGRITGYLISLESRDTNSNNYPVIQVWRSSSQGGDYSKVGTLCQPTDSDINMMTGMMGSYYLGNVSCIGNNRIKFQVDDVTGYHQSNQLRYALWTIHTMGYTSYSRNAGSPTRQNFDISGSNVNSNMEPLIQVYFDIQCDNLSTPANGRIVSCHSGIIGVGYEGDTCSFECNTGYEITGSVSRACLSNGSWSGTDDLCGKVVTISDTTAMVTINTTGMLTTNTAGLAITNTGMVTINTTGMLTTNTAGLATTNTAGLAITNTGMVTINTTGMATTNNTAELVTTYTGMVTINTTGMVTTKIAIGVMSTSTVGIGTMLFTSTVSTSTVVGSPTQKQSDDEGSSIGGIVTGCVVAFILVIIIAMCLTMYLVWYHFKKKGKYIATTGLGFIKQNENNTLEKAGYEHVYSDISNSVTIQNALYNDTNHYGYPYMEPVNTIKVGKFAKNDYETPPQLSIYEKPSLNDLFGDSSYETIDFPLLVSSSIRSNSQLDSTLQEGEALPEGDQIYEDPGHIKDEIYEWLKAKSIRNLDKSSIRISDLIGSGEFGVVHFGLYTNSDFADPVQVAVKTLNSQCSDSDRVKFLREAAIMGQFLHSNVVQLYGVVTEEDSMMIVLEYMPKGDLRNHLLKINAQTIKAQGANSELKHDLLSYCRQITLGVNYLVSKQFVHRDLAARNILVSSDDVCKIADFGMARDVADDNYYVTSGGKIPVKWTAPEAIFYKKYSAQSDIWSFGCVMFEVWSLGHKPFEDYNSEQYVEKITHGFRLPPPPGCPRSIYELMIQCWHPRAKNRPYPGAVLRTLQKSDRNLLQWSVSDGDITNGLAAHLGAPLSTSEKLYPDLQSLYETK